MRMVVQVVRLGDPGHREELQPQLRMLLPHHAARERPHPPRKHPPRVGVALRRWQAAAAATPRGLHRARHRALHQRHAQVREVRHRHARDVDRREHRRGGRPPWGDEEAAGAATHRHGHRVVVVVQKVVLV